MTAHISKPFVHVEDANGNPYVSAKLYVYDVGTTNLKAIYSNEALTVSLANPLTSDAAGNFARAYVAAGRYKLRAETSTATLIWEYDGVDTGLTSGSGALAISAGGTGAITAAAARTALGAASQTDVDDLSSDIATLSSSLQNIVSIPQGRLTIVSGTPVPNTDVSAGTGVAYTPYIGDQIPIWDGAQFNLTTFTELTLNLSSNHLANQLYDVFVWNESGSVLVGTGPAWNSATAGSSSRGSGAGTTELTRQNGLWVNAQQMTTRNGSTTYTVDPSKGTYVGSILIDGTNGQISQHVTTGQSRSPGPWNAYNRRPRVLKVVDSTASWTYATNTIRPSNNDSNNKATVICGLAEEYVSCEFSERVSIASTGSNIGAVDIGIGVHSTTTISGRRGRLSFQSVDADISGASIVASHSILPFLGVETVTCLEVVPNAATSQTLLGTETNMLLTARWDA